MADLGHVKPRRLRGLWAWRLRPRAGGLGRTRTFRRGIVAAMHRIASLVVFFMQALERMLCVLCVL